MGKIWNYWLGLLSPLLFGTPIGSTIGVALGAPKKDLLLWMSLASSDFSGRTIALTMIICFLSFVSSNILFLFNFIGRLFKNFAGEAQADFKTEVYPNT